MSRLQQELGKDSHSRSDFQDRQGFESIECVRNALEFRHNAYDDPQYTIGAGRVAFNLSSLPDTKGETVDLVVNYWTSEGKQAYKLKYNSDKTKMEDTSQGYTNDSISNITDMK